MKNINILIAGILLSALSACKKSDKEQMPMAASIIVINAATDVPNLKVQTSGKVASWVGTTAQVTYGARGFYFAPVGSANLIAVPSADTTKILFNSSINLSSKIYTMYLAGTTAMPDTMFREELNFPLIRSDYSPIPSVDSVVNVRFVNLSVGSPALKVKLATSVANEVDNLLYKEIGAWKAYPAKLITTAYNFQIRRVDTDALVTTFSFSATATNRFKNVALVIRGVFGTTIGTAPFGVSTINYF